MFDLFEPKHNLFDLYLQMGNLCVKWVHGSDPNPIISNPNPLIYWSKSVRGYLDLYPLSHSIHFSRKFQKIPIQNLTPNLTKPWLEFQSS
jgi:hypothetical protein